MTNEQLTQQLILLQSGDMTAFDKIYNELSTPVFAVIVRITRDRRLSEDILQEVFIKIAGIRGGTQSTFSPASVKNPRAYIFQAARNMALDALRKQPHHQSLDEIEDIPSPAEDNTAERLDLESALSQLSEAERTTVTLHINADLKFREIAQITSTPLGTVLWRYNRAIQKLRDILNGGAL